MPSPAEIRAYTAAHPELTSDQTALALGVTRSDYHNAVRKNRRDRLAELTARLLPMLPGEGDRRDGCQNYHECLNRAARVYGGDAHCPVRCERYEAIPAEWWLRIAVELPRQVGEWEHGRFVEVL